MVVRVCDMRKVSRYKERLMRERANSGCEMLAFILDKWRKEYPVLIGNQRSIDKSFEIYEKLLKDADRLASQWDKEYKEAAGII